MSKVIIEAVNVEKDFASGEIHVLAVRGINLAVMKGEMLAIVGPSGSGKSTLLNLLGAIETPTSGKVLLEGKDMASLDDNERSILRRKRIGFIFQAFNLLPSLTSLENVALPLELDGVGQVEAQKRALAALEKVNVAKRKDHLPGTMSGGEQQRVAIARALVIEPALLLADEPTGNLDSANGVQVMRLLKDLVRVNGQTVVIVTHDSDVAAQADRIVHVRDGHLEHVGGADQELRPAQAPMPAPRKKKSRK